MTHTHITFYLKYCTNNTKGVRSKSKIAKHSRGNNRIKKVNAGKTGTNTSKTACKLH